jgi:hypothetical protein
LAANEFTLLAAPNFPQVLDRAIESSLGTMVDNAFARVHLTHCYWSDKHCDCRELGTIHHVASERDFCERHFAALGGDRG